MKRLLTYFLAAAASSWACSDDTGDPPGGAGGMQQGTAGAGGSAPVPTPDAGAPDAAGDTTEDGPDPILEGPDPGGPRPPTLRDGGAPATSTGRALDLLFMIDNSLSMSDKQAILQRTVPDLVQRLINPLCVDGAGATSAAPAPGASCPEGQQREFEPFEDLHIGVISSSLGDVGANVACAQPGSPGFVPDRIDRAHLIGSLARGQNAGANAQGFLEWTAGTTDSEAFEANVQQMVLDVGENGCGFEAQLESWYRFLIDPFPYRELVRVQCPGSPSAALNCVQPATDAEDRIVLDDTLLAQRQAFLRPDSMVAVVMLTDENDCSMQVGNQTWVFLAIDDTRPFFRGSSACATNPNDACCYSCPLGPPDGCASDPICDGDPENNVLPDRLPADEDGQNLRCFQQKRRFGVEALYPTQRYVNALKRPTLCWNALDLGTDVCAAADIVPNPLYAGGRDASSVFLAGIVGVPWQAIASETTAEGTPLQEGVLRFQDASELEANGTWDAILGSPGTPAVGGTSGAAPVPPALPQMVESALPRTGVTEGNPINGRDYDTAFNGTPDDLEYACIFELPEPRDCAALDPASDQCDCYAGAFDKPLCEESPGVSAPGTTQFWAKAYPSLRELEVLRGHGENAVVGSICARNVEDDTLPDFGYRPVITGLIERIRAQSTPPSP